MSILAAFSDAKFDPDRPRRLHECAELWMNPEAIDRLIGFAWRWDEQLMARIAEGEAGWTDIAGYRGLVGHYVVYDLAGVHRVWKVVGVSDRHGGMIQLRWPD